LQPREREKNGIPRAEPGEMPCGAESEGGLIVLQADFELMDGFLRGPKRIGAVTAEVVLSVLQVFACMAERCDCFADLRVVRRCCRAGG
jgi:hypothetical protein